MKTILIIACSIMMISFFYCCKSSSKASKTTTMQGTHNSMTSLDWEGTYYGVLPCADCQGIETVISLRKDMSYTLKTKYQGKPELAAIETSGSFSWNKEGNKISLSNQSPSDYFVGENRLTKLDMNSNRITGDLASKYVLNKQFPAITEKYWKLTEVFGSKVVKDENQRKEPHMILRVKDNRVNGNGGCNTFNGTYELKPNERISFSQMASTMMACKDMETEGNFLKALNTADGYILKGDTLVLIRARMAPLARFEAVYFQ